MLGPHLVRSEAQPPRPPEPAIEDPAVPRPQVWWLSCHGGAGTTTLAYLTGIGRDLGQQSPTRDFAALAHVGVVLVCRESAAGAKAASHTLGAITRLHHPPRLLGLAVVAAEDKRSSREVAERIGLLEVNMPRLWRIPFVREYLAVDDPARVGAHPAIQDLAAELGSLLPGREAAGAR